MNQRLRATRATPVLCLLALFLAAVPCLAQEASVGAAEDAAASNTSTPSPIPEDFASPRATIATFLLYANQAVNDPENETALLQVFRTMDVPSTAGMERDSMAVKLLGFFNGLGEIDVETMAPGLPEVEADRLSRFEFFPNNPYPATRGMIRRAIFDTGGREPPASVVLVRTDSGEWKFSSETMDDVGRLWSWVEVRGVQHGVDIREISASEYLRDRFIPQALKGQFILGFELWQWVGLALILFVAALCDRLSRLALRPGARWLTRRAIGEINEAVAQATLRPVGMLLGALIFWALLRPLGLVGLPLVVLVVAVKLVIVFSAAWTVWAITDLLAEASLQRTKAHELSIDNMIIPLLRRTAKLLILAFSLVYTASALDINLLPLLGSLGIAGLAISFAAQDIVKNIFGGVTIFLDRPFKTGDQVKYGGYDGFVEHIGFRSTKVKTFAGHLVTIPNGVLTSEAVENVFSRTTIMRSFSVTITYDTPREKVEQAVELIQGILEEDGIRESINPTIDGSVWSPLVRFDKFNADSLNIFVMYWHEPPSWYTQMAHTQQVNLRIFEEFEKAGIEFAFPTQTLHIAGDSKRARALQMLNSNSGVTS